MLRLIFLSSILSTAAFSSALSCSDGNPEGIRFTVITYTIVLSSEHAAYIEKMDVANEFPVILGLYERRTANGLLSFSFAEAGKVDWSKINKKSCFTKLGNWVNVDNIQKNTTDAKGDYLAKVTIAPRIEIRPGQEKTCPVPHVVIRPPTPVTCNEVDIDLK